VSWVVVGNGGAGRDALSNVRRAQMNVSVRPHVTACLGLHTIVVGCLLRGEPSPWW
jgi:hypothetical protein